MSKSKSVPAYIVNPIYVQERVDKKVYARVEKQTAKWTPVTNMGDSCGNVRPIWDIKKGKFSFSLKDEFNPGCCGMYQVISSALFLYRLLCLFKCTVKSEGPEGYKNTWWITLQHKETGEKLTFGEWKGAAGTFTRFHAVKELPASYKKDTVALLNEICSPDCPHPYDGCVAGSVA